MLLACYSHKHISCRIRTITRKAIIGIDASEAILILAKTGVGIKDVLETIVKNLPAPKGNSENLLRILGISYQQIL